MDASAIERLKRARKENPDAVFSLFTLAGHVLSGRITALDGTATLEAGKETCEVALDRVEAFSYRQP
jgi:hypothetical protein